MTKRILLALIVCASTLAWGDSTDFDTGNFQSGVMAGQFKAGSTLNVSITGSLHTIDLVTGPLVRVTQGCPVAAMCFDFSSGSTTVSANGTTVFTDQLVGGLTIKSNGSGSINADLMAEPGVAAGSATVSFDFTGMKITAGSENVAFNTTITPEPAGLMLFATGLLGCGALAKRKLRK